MRRLLLATVLALTAFGAEADQFGLKPGASLAEIQKLVHLKKEDGAYVYSTSTVPRGHPAFEDYRLLITPQHGLCKISAWTPIIQTNSFGDAIKSQFEDLLTALTAKYGEPKKFDYLRDGSIWNEPQDWTMGLAKEDRTLTAYWLTSQGADLGPEIVSIKLEASAANSQSGIINVSYDFKNTHECLEWIKQQNNAAL